MKNKGGIGEKMRNGIIRNFDSNYFSERLANSIDNCYEQAKRVIEGLKNNQNENNNIDNLFNSLEASKGRKAEIILTATGIFAEEIVDAEKEERCQNLRKQYKEVEIHREEEINLVQKLKKTSGAEEIIFEDEKSQNLIYMIKKGERLARKTDQEEYYDFKDFNILVNNYIKRSFPQYAKNIYRIKLEVHEGGENNIDEVVENSFKILIRNIDKFSEKEEKTSPYNIGSE